MSVTPPEPRDGVLREVYRRVRLTYPEGDPERVWQALLVTVRGRPYHPTRLRVMNGLRWYALERREGHEHALERLRELCDRPGADDPERALAFVLSGHDHDKDPRRAALWRACARAGWMYDGHDEPERAWRALRDAADREPRLRPLDDFIRAFRDRVRQREDGHEFAATRLRELCDHPVATIADHARRALLRADSPQLRGLLPRLLRAGSSDDRSTAVHATATLLPVAEAVALLRPLLDDDDVAVVHQVLANFTRWRAPTPAPTLERLLAHPSHLVRRHANRLAEALAFQPSWPAALHLALLGSVVADRVVAACVAKLRYAWIERPTWIPAWPGDARHRVAVALLLGPLEGLRALPVMRAADVTHNLGHGVRMTELAARFHRQRLLRALLQRAATITVERDMPSSA